MNGIPTDLDLDFLKGATLSQVAIGEYQVQFNFAPEGSLAVEGKWTLNDGNGEQVEISSSRPYIKVQALLGKQVSRCEINPPTSLTLHFENGYSLSLYDSSEEYESFTVQPGNIVV